MGTESSFESLTFFFKEFLVLQGLKAKAVLLLKHHAKYLQIFLKGTLLAT